MVLLFSVNVSAVKVSDDFYVYGKQTEELAKIFNMTEKELLVELVIELKNIDRKCDDIARKIVVWSNFSGVVCKGGDYF